MAVRSYGGSHDLRTFSQQPSVIEPSTLVTGVSEECILYQFIFCGGTYDMFCQLMCMCVCLSVCLSHLSAGHPL